MNIVDTCNVIPLHANYYLFGVYYEGELDSQTQKTNFPSWHLKQSLVGKEVSQASKLQFIQIA
ncbi:hypothetical protein [Vibrio cionasavignyae]|uniref:hypothetical protein n=1 Tax=Vibrio cionasavignyae TaxID=2910252 RepID=UPI003D0AAEE4